MKRSDRARGVHLAGIDYKPVADLSRLDDLRRTTSIPYRSPQPGHHGVQPLAVAFRYRLSPQRLRRAIARYRLTRLQCQQREQRALFWPAERGSSLADAQLHRAE